MLEFLEFFIFGPDGWSLAFGPLAALGLSLGASALGGLLSKRGSTERGLSRFSTAPFESEFFQRFLPPSLRLGRTGPILGTGIEGLGELIRRPGGLSPGVSEAILPRLAQESESIAQNFRGIQAQQAGRAARQNVPVSIKTALESALDVAQERAQRGTRRAALAESEELRRLDLGKTFDILDAILQFASSGRGQAIQGLGAAGRLGERRKAGFLGFLGSLLNSRALGGLGSDTEGE